MFKNFLRYFLAAVIVVLGAAFAITVGAAVIQNWQSNTSGTSTSVANIDGNGGFNVTGSGAFNFSPPGTLSVVSTNAVASGGTAGGTFLGATLSSGTLTSGTLSVYEPFQGSSYKEVIIIANSAYSVTQGTVNITLPTAFATSQGTMVNTLAGSANANYAITAGSGGVLTLGGTATGILIIGGQ